VRTNPDVATSCSTIPDQYTSETVVLDIGQPYHVVPHRGKVFEALAWPGAPLRASSTRVGWTTSLPEHYNELGRRRAEDLLPFPPSAASQRSLSLLSELEIAHLPRGWLYFAAIMGTRSRLTLFLLVFPFLAHAQDGASGSASTTTSTESTSITSYESTTISTSYTTGSTNDGATTTDYPPVSTSIPAIQTVPFTGQALLVGT
jgi:hypothetical protein